MKVSNFLRLTDACQCSRLILVAMCACYLRAVWQVMWCWMFFCLQDARVCVWGCGICSALSFCWSFPLFSCCIQEAAFRTDPWLSWQDTPLPPPVPTGRQWEVSHEVQELCVFVCMKWWRGFISGVGDFPLGNCRFIPAERPSRLRARLVRAFNSWGWRHERNLTCSVHFISQV